MKRVSLGVVVVLMGALPSMALADHPGEVSDLTPAIEGVLGEDTTQASSGVLKVPLDDGTVLRTHGPDVSPGAADPLAVAGPSDRFLAGSAERAPLCATDYALQIIYARSPTAPDRFATVAPQLRSVVKRSNHVLNEEAIASGGGGGDYKVTCSDGEIDVRSFTTSATSFGQVVDAARAAGFTSPARNYVIFLDSNVSGYCGVGSLYFSDTPSLSNPHNTNGGYSVVYKGCWEGTTFMHEVGHNRGAVQPAAPGSTGSGAHCNEGHDVMCYAPDGGDLNQAMVYPCSTLTRFDCNFDTYFDAAPEAGEWLSNHWNLGRQGQNFLVISAADPAADTTPPQTEITRGPAPRIRPEFANFQFTGSDGVTPTAELVYFCSVDGGGFGPCTSPTRLSGIDYGRHTFRVSAVDAAGNADESPAEYTWTRRRR